METRSFQNSRSLLRDVQITKKYIPKKVEDGTYTIDLTKSKVWWIGRNRGNSHFGTISITKGEVEVVADGIKGSGFALDFNTLKCTDLQGNPSHEYLINHLHSADFFFTSQFPECTVKITSFERISGRTNSEPNYDIVANLTLRGQTHEIEFEAAIHANETGLTAQAHVDVDRTDWGMVYGSERFLRHLGCIFSKTLLP